MMNNERRTEEKEFDNNRNYIIFRIEGQAFALTAESVEEIIMMRSITRFPRKLPLMEGVVNLREKPLVVADIRERLRIRTSEKPINNYIMVVNQVIKNETMKIGILAEDVNEVVDVANDQIMPVASQGSLYEPRYLRGMFKVRGHQQVHLIDASCLFTADDLVLFHYAEQKAVRGYVKL